jgi:hypothetical protein
MNQNSKNTYHMKSIKKFFFVAVSILTMTATVFAQAPQKFSYQAVLRDNAGAILGNDAVGMKISILQGSMGGTAVYAETHAPTTNVNGLVSLEVGTGTVVSGNFSTIDWANGPYFIKSETDPTGGTSYTITGTSQLMSVPYAFYAAVSDSLVGYTPVDSTAIADMGYVAGLKTYEVGDFAHGGVVFWVDESKQHGLVVTKSDVNAGIRWYAEGGMYGTTRATGDGVYGGAMNTSLIISAQLVIGDDGDPYAASICADLVVTEDGVSYGDWYLPTAEELKVLGAVYPIVDATAVANGGTNVVFSPQWSSTETSTNEATVVLMNPGGVSSFNSNKAATFTVRAVRAF